MVHVLLPIKDQVLAKSRLSGVLARDERRSLNQAMVEDVLTVIPTHPDIESVTLVSKDPAAKLLADVYETDWFDERRADAKNLNDALGAACAYVSANSAINILILHGDLPFLQGADIDALIEQSRQSKSDVVIGPDAADNGTNALLISAASRPALRFGLNSFARHYESAAEKELSVAVVRRPGIANDIDRAEDLIELFAARIQTKCGRRTAQFLSRPDVVERLQLLADSKIGTTPEASAAANE